MSEPVHDPYQRLETLETINADTRLDYNHNRRRLRVQMALCLAAVAGGLLLVPTSRPARAQQNGGVPSLEQRVGTLEKAVASLQSTVTSESAQIAALQTTTNTQTSQIAALQAALSQETAVRQAADSALDSRASALEGKTQFVSVNSGEMYITGTNLHIVNGLGATNGSTIDAFNPWGTQVNGLGNLIIGYNELRNNPDYPDNRTGSHNLVIGAGNNYSSYGGLVVGELNGVSGAYAAVLCGTGNNATGDTSSVTAGHENTASGYSASVSGGAFNTASGPSSAISGGLGNAVSGGAAAISGGLGISLPGDLSWAGGSLHSP